MAKKGIVDIHGKQYKTVVLRVNEFRAECPIKDGWGIITEIVELNETWACVKAAVIDPDERVVGCGHGIEFWQGNNKINKTSALENAETSAVGRALSSIGLGGEEYASADEVLNAIKTQKVMEVEEESLPEAVDAAPEIMDDIDDLVSENLEILCNRLGKEQAIDWHKKVMENFFGGKKRAELDKEGLAKLADIQNQRIKNIGGDNE
jgi:hypothetical protein